MYDTHLHCSFSGDCEAAPSEVIKSAKEKGLLGIIFTDHNDFDYKMEPGLFDLDIPNYTKAINALAKKENSDFYIGCGIELGLMPHLAKRHEKLLSENNFDFVIGAVHTVNGMDPFFPDFFEGSSILHFVESYFESTLENLMAFHDIDALAHLDYIMRYATKYAKERGEEIPDIHKATIWSTIEAILHFLIKHDICLEINTSPIRKGFVAPNPPWDVIETYYKMGGRMITLGSDAHRPEHLADSFYAMAARLNFIGLSSQMVFKNRKPQEIPFDIPEVGLTFDS